MVTATKVSKTIEIMTVTVPGKTETDPVARYNFTTHDSPVTVDGVQYIPLSVFDQAKWAKMCNS